MTATSIRNVRPSWAVLKIDNASNDPQEVRGAGPRSRTGSLSVDILARIDGASVPMLTVDAIASADGKSTLFRVVDRTTGSTVFERKVSQ